MQEKKHIKPEHIEEYIKASISEAIINAKLPITTLKRTKVPVKNRLLIALLEMNHEELPTLNLRLAAHLTQKYGKLICLEHPLQNTGYIENRIKTAPPHNIYEQNLKELCINSAKKNIHVVCTGGVDTLRNIDTDESDLDEGEIIGNHNQIVAYTICHFTTELEVISINNFAHYKELFHLFKTSGMFDTIIPIVLVPAKGEQLKLSQDSFFLKITGDNSAKITTAFFDELIKKISQLVPATVQQEEKKGKRAYTQFSNQGSSHTPTNFFSGSIKTNIDLFFEAIRAGNLTHIKQALMEDLRLISSVNKLGDSALHVAVEVNNRQIMDFLVASGISLVKKNLSGLTAQELAEKINKEWPCSFPPSHSAEDNLMMAIKSTYGSEEHTYSST